MQTEKKLFVPLFITFVMVVGAFAAMVPAPGTMSAVGDRESSTDTRFEYQEPVTYASALDSFMNEQEILQTETDVAANTESVDDSVLVLEQPEVYGPQQIESELHIEATEVPATEGTRAVGNVDAGGPYGGPSTYEDVDITFTATADDPILIFFRWGFNTDLGMEFTPWKMSLTMSDTITRHFDDDYFGDVVAEAWDGISLKPVSSSFTIHDGMTGPVNAYHVPWILGYEFLAKKDLVVTELGAMRGNYNLPIHDLKLWRKSTRSVIAGCTPLYIPFEWHWCSVSPTLLNEGELYAMTMYKYYESGRYTPLTMWANVQIETDDYRIDARVFRWRSGGFDYPDQGYYPNSYVDFFDMKFEMTIYVPDSASDTAFLEVNNVAPTVANVQVNPPMAYEGGSTEFTAEFSDPGSGDTWEYRWDFGDGSFSEWLPIEKWLGGADILFATTWYDAAAQIVADDVAEICGAFCKSIDLHNWYFNGVPDLDTMLEYDVVVVGTNIVPSSALAEEFGDRLADYSDGGGAVVQMWSSFHTSARITGRWTDDLYNAIVRGSLHYGWRNMGIIHVPGHPIMNGVTALRAYYKHNSYGVTPGATRLADYTDGKVLAAFKTNPIVPNDARIVGLAYYPCANIQGDWDLMLYNAIRWASQQPDPYSKPMPITLPATTHVYADDDPVTESPFDTITVTAQVRDDDHMRVNGGAATLMDEDFTGFRYPSKPAGWTSVPSYGWRIYSTSQLGSDCYNHRWYYNDGATSILYAPSFDLSTYNLEANVSFRHYWQANYNQPWVVQDGYFEVSIDGGMTWSILGDWHHMDPEVETESYTFDLGFATGQPDVRVRWRIVMEDDYYWFIDDVVIEGVWGVYVWGLGEASSTIQIVNVEPTIHKGPTSGLLDEGGIIDLVGYEISDPALYAETEWFAYKWDFGDGTGTDWFYKGTLKPPQSDILILHTCYVDQGCINRLQETFEDMDLTGIVELWDFLYTYINGEQAPTLAYMQEFQVILVTSLYGYGSPPSGWTTLKRTIGDRLAAFVDLGGAVITQTAAIDDSPFATHGWRLLGRYIDDEYAPFKLGDYVISTVDLGDVHVSHPIIEGPYLITDVTSGAVHSGNYATSAGGIRIASWEDGGAFVGAKIHPKGKTVHYGADGGGNAQAGSSGQYEELLYNIMAWIPPDMPTPELDPYSHQYGDNGMYYVDITVIDDDMGWTWDMAGNMPVASPNYPSTLSHYIVPISVNNVDPTLHSMRAYTEAELCIRMTGNKGNMATLTLIGSDGTYMSATATRVPGNPAIACLDPVEIDISTGTTYDVSILYDPVDDDGANPIWTFSAEFPKGKIKELKYTFQSADGVTTMTIGNQAFKRMAIGSPITFEAFADDPGSDDLAFVWAWGPEGTGDPAYDIHIWAHPGWFLTESTYMNPADLPFGEPDFVKSLNDVRSPEYDPIRVTDKATHTFSEDMFGSGPTTPWFVYLLVMDDDVDDNYPSPYGHPGVDMDFIVLDW